MNINLAMGKTVAVDEQVILDLVKVKDEFDSIIESLELMADRKFMNSYKKSQKQVKKKEFDSWNGL